jgi:DNA-binding MarR family transcriptional regulator
MQYMMKSDLSEVTRYLNETLGISVTPKPLASVSRLPFFLQNLYSLFEIKILDNICMLAVDHSEEEQSPAIVRKHMDQIRAKFGKEMVYVRTQVTAYNRKRLIAHKVAFIVPGNQMYLPMLGIDMREHFRTSRLQPVKLNPSTQAAVIYLCIKNADEVITPAEIARHLGYSAMTLTRAFDELEALGIGEFSDQGRKRCLRFTGGKKTIWEKSLPQLRSPVKRRFYIRTKDKEHLWPVSGLSALAHYTMLAEPHNQVFALSSVDWKKYSQLHQVSNLTLQEPDTFEIEIWSYDPLLFSEEGVVDRMSLYLSLKDNHDERIESAMDRMMKEMKW